jgi:hypothetical protein
MELTDPHQASEKARIYVEVGLTEAKRQPRGRFAKWCESIEDPLQRAMVYIGAARAAIGAQGQ